MGALDGHPACGHTGSGGGFKDILLSLPNEHLTVVILTNTDAEQNSTGQLATAIARQTLDLPAIPLRDLPVPAEELAALVGTFDSDEGSVTNFAKDGKLRFRIGNETGDGGRLLRQSANVYAIDDSHEVHFQVRDETATWAFVCAAGLMLDAKRRVP